MLDVSHPRATGYTHPITSDDVELLIGIIDDLVVESDERRDRASMAIAELIPRLSESDRRPLTTRLARRLAESQQLRCQFGIERVRQVVTASPALDQQILVSRLCLDVLIEPKANWAFTLPTGELPRLDGAVAMAEGVCELALSTRESAGLRPDADAALMAWLRHRRVAVDSKTHDCPFILLDKLVEQYEDSLLDALGETYVDQLTAELESHSISDIALPSCIERAKKVLASMIEAGPDSGARCWNMVARLATVQAAEGPEFAWDFLSRHLDNANSSEVSVTVAALCERLEKNLQEEDGWELDGETGAQTLLTVAETRTADLAPETVGALSALIGVWGDVDETATFAARGAELVLRTAREKVDAHVTAWAGGILGDTPLDLVRWLGGGFATKL